MSVSTTLFILVVLITSPACSRPPDPRRTDFEIKTQDVYAKYDSKSGKLQRINIDQNKNGVMDAFSYWDGAQLLRIELDKDEDGKIDGWEHYDARRQLARLGSSSKNDEVEDTWSFPDASGFLSRVETDTDRDGTIDKRDFYIPRPGNSDQRVLSVVEYEIDKAGNPGRRLHYRPDGQFDRSEALRP